jgi:two-component system, OmpR family, sensor kinase
VSRLPIRARLTLAFAVAMAVVLAATGALVYLGLRSALDEAINDSLESRVEDLAAGHSPEASSDESRGQVIDGSGHVVGDPGEEPLLPRQELARVEPGRQLRLEREQVAGIDGRGRLLATAVDSPRGRRVVVAAASLDDRDGALGDLVGQLVIFGPAALLLASLLGYGLATAALRPVEAMREEAATISGAEPGRRLSIGRANDELGRLGTTLNDMLERLDAALEHERSFIADASHELRTPLALLKAELELSLRRPRTAEELEEALRSAAGETDRLTRLAEHLLVLARSDQGPLTLRREPIVAKSLAGKVAGRFAAAGRAIEVEVPDGLGVSGDSVRLEQALGDLVANALEHGSGTVSITGAEEDGQVELHVLDEGPGFSPAFLPRAFERFSRADEARSGGGAGLGLAIVDAIARGHGGSAHAANRPDGGADVWLSLPASYRVERG